MTDSTATGGTKQSAPDREAVSVDVEGEPALLWSGPAVAPMAVAAVSCLYGPLAMIEHPGLASLRMEPNFPEDRMDRRGSPGDSRPQGGS